MVAKISHDGSTTASQTKSRQSHAVQRQPATKVDPFQSITQDASLEPRYRQSMGKNTLPARDPAPPLGANSFGGRVFGGVLNQSRFLKGQR